MMPAVGVGVAEGGLVGGASILLWRHLVNNGIATRPSSENAKKLLMKERQSLFLLENWFKSSTNLLKSVEALIGLEVVKVIFKDCKSLFKARKLNNEVLIKSILLECIQNAYAIRVLHNKFGPLFAPVVVTFLYVVFLFHEKNKFLLGCVLKSSDLNFNNFELDSNVDVRKRLKY
ncbi:uncharacterized protein NPIL_559441 [Nephila pilipes]|uniref:Uncharacterized protein n=1 Tax=Nephila pilipes TaxID=299642 RepID=A0A8X6PGH9_NEPPI|nr:uncharacterized protein NPIL_559441 [Nephila pilipes]